MRALVRSAPDEVRHAGLAAATIALGVFVGFATVHSDVRTTHLAAIGLVVLGGAAILLSLPPRVLFLGWFGVAPLLQESSSYSPVGHKLGLVLYFAPSLLFALWTLTTRRPRRTIGVVDLFPLAFFVYTLAWVVGEHDASSRIVKGVYVTVGIGIVLYYFFAAGPVATLSPTHVVGGVLAVALVEAVMSIVDGLTRWNLWHDRGWQFGADSRAVATLSNPAILGTLLGMGIVFALAILVWDGPPTIRKLAIAVLVVGPPGLYFTLTRAPILSTAAAVVIVLLTRTKTRIVAAVVFILATAVVLLSWDRITSSNVYRQRITNATNVEARILIQDWSWKLATERPVFGWGYGSFDRVKNAADFSSGTIPVAFGTQNTSHNTYLTVLVELGFVGLLLLAVPWLVVPWRAAKAAVRGERPAWLVVGGVASIAVYVAAANAGDFKFFSFVPAVAWALLGLLRRSQTAEV